MATCWPRRWPCCSLSTCAKPVADPRWGHVLLAVANAAALVVLVLLLLRGWLPGRPMKTRADRT